MHVKYDQVWEKFLKDNYFPTYLRNVREIESSELESCVLNDESTTSELILDLLAGDLFIVRNVLTSEQASRIKKSVHHYGQSIPPEDLSEISPNS